MLYKFFNAPETDLFSGNTHEMMSWFKAVWGRSTRGKYVLFERLDVGLNNTCGEDYSSGGGHILVYSYQTFCLLSKALSELPGRTIL